MSFLWPGILVLTTAVSIPIIIHLLGERRYERIYFSSIRLLKQLETDSLRRIRMRQWLILILRSLGILFLVLALAGPFSGGCRLSAPGRGILIVDMSPSSRFHPDYNIIKDQIRQDFPDWPALETDLSLPISTDPGEQILNVLKESLTAPEHCIILTDLQQNEDTESLLAAAKESLNERDLPRIIKLRQQESATYIKSLYIPQQYHPAGEFVPLTALVSSPEERVPLAYLTVNGKRLAQTRPDDNNDVFFSFLVEYPGDYSGSIRLEGSDHPFNQRYFSLTAGQKIRILYTGDAGSYLYPALEALTAVELYRVSPADFTSATLTDIDILLMDGLIRLPENQLNRIELFSRENPVLLIMDRVPDTSWKNFLSIRTVEAVDLPEGRFRQTEIPDIAHPAFQSIRPFAVQKYFRTDIKDTQAIYQLTGGDPFFLKYNNSNLYLLTSPFRLDYNRMGTDAWFTRTIKTILYTISGSYETELIVGDEIPIRLAGDQIIRPDGHTVRILDDYTDTDIPGIYILRSNGEDYIYSVNWPETETEDRYLKGPLPGFDIIDGTEESVEFVRSTLKGKSLTPYLFLLAAICWCGELWLMILNQKKRKADTHE
jgi:hypothetical protein